MELGAKETPKWTKGKKIYASERLRNIIQNKYLRVLDLYPKHPSLQHSAYVLQEEFNEVMQEMRAKDGLWDYERIYEELLDLIVAAIRMMLEHFEVAQYINKR